MQKATIGQRLPKIHSISHFFKRKAIVSIYVDTHSTYIVYARENNQADDFLRSSHFWKITHQRAKATLDEHIIEYFATAIAALPSLLEKIDVLLSSVRVRTCLAAPLVMRHVIQAPEMRANEIGDFIKMKMEQFLPGYSLSEIEQLYLDYRIFKSGTVGAKLDNDNQTDESVRTSKLDIYICERSVIDKMHSICRNNGVILDNVSVDVILLADKFLFFDAHEKGAHKKEVHEKDAHEKDALKKKAKFSLDMEYGIGQREEIMGKEKNANTSVSKAVLFFAREGVWLIQPSDKKGYRYDECMLDEFSHTMQVDMLYDAIVRHCQQYLAQTDGGTIWLVGDYKQYHLDIERLQNEMNLQLSQDEHQNAQDSEENNEALSQESVDDEFLHNRQKYYLNLCDFKASNLGDFLNKTADGKKTDFKADVIKIDDIIATRDRGAYKQYSSEQVIPIMSEFAVAIIMCYMGLQ